jgi:hypothetical protein
MVPLSRPLEVGTDRRAAVGTLPAQVRAHVLLDRIQKFLFYCIIILFYSIIDQLYHIIDKIYV